MKRWIVPFVSVTGGVLGTLLLVATLFGGGVRIPIPTWLATGEDLARWKCVLGGDEESCEALGNAYFEVNRPLAAAYLDEACDGGMPDSCNSLGALLTDIEGVRHDLRRGVRLLRKACDAGSARGCRNLSLMYQRGTGVRVDHGKEAHYLGRACDAGSAKACGDLGVMYYLGTGVAKDRVRALALARRACHGDDARGCNNVGAELEAGLEGAPDFAQVLDLYARSCNADFALGCSNQAALLARGRPGVQRDEARAAVLYERGCRLGDQDACRLVGSRDTAQATDRPL